MTADVLAFLRAAHDEIERVAGALDAQGWVDRDYGTGRGDVVVDMDDALPDAVADGCSYGDEHDPMSPEQARHIALHDPRAALARVQAEQVVLALLVEMNEGAMGRGEWGDPQVLHESDELIRTLAHGHRYTVPGYDPAWAPEGVSADA